MAKNREPSDWIECCVCQKNLYVAAKRKVKKINGTGRIAISKTRQLRDGRWVCSDVCFGLIVNPPSEPTGLDPD